MQPSLYEQTMVFLRAFGAGALLAAVYTVLSCIRAVSEPDKKFLFAGDLVFALSAGALSFVYSLGTSGGRFRAYAIAAECVSFFALYLTLGRLLAHSADRSARLVSRLVCCVCLPIKKVCARLSGSLEAAARKIYLLLSKKFKKNKI